MILDEGNLRESWLCLIIQGCGTDTIGISPSRRTGDHTCSRSSIMSCAFACRAKSSGVRPESFLRCLSAPYRSTIVGLPISIRKIDEKKRGGGQTKTSPLNRVINGSHVQTRRAVIICRIRVSIFVSKQRFRFFVLHALTQAQELLAPLPRIRL